MSIHHWPSTERPREKLLARGAPVLSDAELLAVFLRTGVSGASALDLARQLLLEFGSLRQLFEVSQERFCRTKGIGPAKFAHLQAAMELNRRYLAQCIHQGDVMESPEAVKQFLIAQLRHRKREVFGCLFLDTKHALLSFELLFHGTLNAASVHPREVLKAALKHNAAAVILCHNHPSGIAEPSSADRRITQTLIEALGLIEVKVLDHIIIGERLPVSFAQRGWI